MLRRIIYRQLAGLYCAPSLWHWGIGRYEEGLTSGALINVIQDRLSPEMRLWISVLEQIVLDLGDPEHCPRDAIAAGELDHVPEAIGLEPDWVWGLLRRHGALETHV